MLRLFTQLKRLTDIMGAATLTRMRNPAIMKVWVAPRLREWVSSLVVSGREGFPLVRTRLQRHFERQLSFLANNK
ncbi:hypothetical protein B7486_04435 [cyanobacterium TDX16]|nr:hypothetical protein B7486_04435 [cyanobacterium TDX16]